MPVDIERNGIRFKPNIPSREDIREEIEQFREDYPNDEEFFDILVDYIEQVAEEVSHG